MRVGLDGAFAALYYDLGVFGEVARPSRADREIFWRTRTAAQTFEEFAEHGYSITSMASASSSERNGKPRTRL